MCLVSIWLSGCLSVCLTDRGPVAGVANLFVAPFHVRASHFNSLCFTVCFMASFRLNNNRHIANKMLPPANGETLGPSIKAKQPKRKQKQWKPISYIILQFRHFFFFWGSKKVDLARNGAKQIAFRKWQWHRYTLYISSCMCVDWYLCLRLAHFSLVEC